MTNSYGPGAGNQPQQQPGSSSTKIILAVVGGVLLVAIIAVALVFALLPKGADPAALATAAPTASAQAGDDPAPTEQATQQAPDPEEIKAALAGTAAPKNAADDGALVFGNPDASTTVTVYYDFMCPYCGHFETANGADLKTMADAGQIRLEYHPLSFLDRASNGTQYSTRAAAAFAAASDADPATALAFNALLFEHQPAEGTEGLDDATIASLASQAGVSPATIDSFGSQTFAPWVGAATSYAFVVSKIEGTPTVLINGQQFAGDLYTPGTIAAELAKR